MRYADISILLILPSHCSLLLSIPMLDGKFARCCTSELVIYNGNRSRFSSVQKIIYPFPAG
uniref:Uncharacterized protein n=1 Tax=Arion vulgaris TaxID=1028688 RepID=A0A0B7AST1_9EUPU